MSDPNPKPDDLVHATSARPRQGSPDTLASPGSERRLEVAQPAPVETSARPIADPAQSVGIPSSLGFAPSSSLTTLSPGANVPSEGTILGGKYRVESVLGTGGMGVVASAHHLQLDQRVAIKYLIPEALEYPELVERFMREARAAARLRSEHVVRVIDVGHFDNQVPFIVLEYLEGESLATRLAERGPLPVVEAARFILEVCEGLAEAHAAHLVHRDIKPANLFVAVLPDRRRIVKILDFGISKIVDEPLTPTLSMLGTTLYMSPEQLRSAKQVDNRTDIWALGVVFYELLTGTAPFTGINVIDVAANIVSNVPTPVNTLRPEVSERLAAVIAKCMQTDPAKRYATVLELATDLAPLANPSDRGSVGTISRVLYGSMAPPAVSSVLSVPPAPAVRTALLPASLPAAAAPEPWMALDDRAPESLPSDAPVSADWGGHGAESSPALDDVPSSDDDAAPRPRQRARSGERRFGGIAVAVAATFVLISGVSWLRARSAGPAPQAAAAHAVPAVTAPSSPITVRLRASPPHARVRIDDGELSPAPVVTTVVPDGREHRIYVEAAGYASQTEVVRFSRDMAVSFVLAPVPSGSSPGAAARPTPAVEK